MKHLTLHFPSLCNLSQFSKRLTGGYLLNTCNLTLTGNISDAQVHLARQFHQAVLIENTELAYSYKLVE